jgi:glucose/arabinose dehydrogenase
VGRRLLPALLTAIAIAATASTAPAATPTLAQIGTFAAPTAVAAPLGDTSRVFVVEQAGTVRVVKDGVTLPRPFLDIHGDVLSGGERGLLSIAFDRGYVTDGRFWIYYTHVGTGAVTVEEGRRSPTDPDVADPGARRVLLSIPHGQQANHNGGQLQVAADGTLFLLRPRHGGSDRRRRRAERLRGGRPAARRVRRRAGSEPRVEDVRGGA